MTGHVSESLVESDGILCSQFCALVTLVCTDSLEEALEARTGPLLETLMTFGVCVISKDRALWAKTLKDACAKCTAMLEEKFPS
jgi:hypothetical protein